MSEPVLHPDFRDLLEELLAERVRFVVVGAHALAVHGVPRATGDLDLFVAADAENATRLIRALTRFGAPLELHGVTAGDFERAGTVYQLGSPPRRIDLMTSISGVAFADAEIGAVPTEIEGLTLGVLGRRELIANKRAAARPKDLLDVDLLESRPADPPK